MAYNADPMPLERFARFVFVIYCAIVGMVLVMLPWSPAWDRMLALLPYPSLDLLKVAWIRGAVTGFGLVHLVWSIHDLDLLLRQLLPELDADDPPSV